MAYPIISGAYGLSARNEIGGLPYAGSTRMIPIQSGYATGLFNGDIVILSAGMLVANTYTPATAPTTPIAGTVGVFVGCEYSNPAGPLYGKLRAQNWVAGNTAVDAVAYVVDDPRVVFKSVVGSQGTSLSNTSSGFGYMSQRFIGTNVYPLSGTAGNLTSGNSSLVVSGGVVTNATGNTAVTAAAPFRVVGVVSETAVTLNAIGSTSGSSTTVTLTTASGTIQAGMQLYCAYGTGTGVNAGNYITVTNVNGLILTVNTAVTIPSGSNIYLVGYPEVLVTWNGNFHSYSNTTGV